MFCEKRNKTNQMKENQPRYTKQYAVGILDFSSQYGGETKRSFSYSVSNIIGEPKIFPKYGDFTQAAVLRTYGPWWNTQGIELQDTRPRAFEFISKDYIDVVFDQAVFPWSIAIYETYNPGAVVRILALCQNFPSQQYPSEFSDSGVDSDISGKVIPLPMGNIYTHWEVLWENAEPKGDLPREARMFAPILREIKYRSRIIRIEFSSTHLDYYTEIDAVELTGTLSYFASSSVDPPSQALSQLSLSGTVTPSSSSEELAYMESKVDYKAAQPVGEPHVYSSVVADLPTHDANLYPSGYFSILPAEIVSKIFSYLPFPDFCRAAGVCQLFRQHSYDPSQLVHLDLGLYWHRIGDNALQSLMARCSPEGSDTHCGLIQSLNLRWLGGGDIVSAAQLSTFLDVCDLANLTYLNLASSYCVTDQIVLKLSKVAPALRHLNVESCDKLTAEGIRFLHKLQKLRSLNLYRTKVDDAGIICIAHANQYLERLNIGSCPEIADYDRVFVELSEHCPLLTSIDAWRARSLTSLGLNNLVEKCEHLEELDLGWCGGLQSNSGCFANLAKCCTKLRKLFLTANRTISDTEINLFAKHCPELRQLDILGTRLVSRAGIDHLIYRCQHLHFLDLSFCFAFNEEAVSSLQQVYPNIAIKRSFQD